MASSGRTERTYHQDYIARIRYSNTLPPPPNPPKLLDIPNDALEQYTSAGFTSRLAREQPLNIEADSELGMPIDLIGIPGVFEGNETALYGHEHPPPPHPHDRPLLRSLAALQKGATASAGVSFLRRTEYISADGNRTARQDPLAAARLEARKRKRPEQLREDDPVRIVRDIVKGFDIAYPEDAAKGPETSANVRGTQSTAEERRDWTQPKHPNDPTLQLLDAYPLLPDFDAVPDGGYYLMKFSTNPMISQDTYDARLDVGVLKPLDPSPAQQEAQEAAEAAAALDPTLPAPPPMMFDYDFYLPQIKGMPAQDVAAAVRQKFDLRNPGRDDAALYPDGTDAFTFNRIRAYETQKMTLTDGDNLYDETVAVTLHDGGNLADGTPKPKAAYVYPVASRSFVRPKRATADNDGRGPPVHVIELSAVDRPAGASEEQDADGGAE